MTSVREPLAERANGRWNDILMALGVDSHFLRDKHGPCPICGGKDRFRFDDKDGRGTFYCSKCGAGDGVQLVKLFRGVEFKEAAKLVEDVIGGAERKIAPNKAKLTEVDFRRFRRELWKGSSPVSCGSAAGKWLTRRCGLEVFPTCLRAHPGMAYRADGSSAVYPGMLALVSDPEGKPAQLHRTFMTRDGFKAPVDECRRMMPGAVPKGSAVRLMDCDGDTLGIAEGIENAFCAADLHGVRVWSAINATMLEGWIPPPHVKRVIVFGDNDDNYQGQASAFRLAMRLCCQAEPLTVDVQIPAEINSDWADVWEAKQPQREAA